MRLPKLEGLSAFFAIWFGQLVSLVGSGLTRFALGVWVFQQTESVTQFTLIAFFATIPGAVALPLGGALSDRLDRRRLMFLSDSVAAAATIVILLLASLDRLAVWHIYIVVTVQGLAAAFQWPSYLASIPLLVPKQHLGRASGVTRTGRAISEIVAPLVAGGLLLIIGLDGIILIDLTTFLFAASVLALVRIPKARQTEAGRAAQGTIRQEIRSGRVYIRSRPGLRMLVIYLAVINFAFAMSQVLITPLVLSFTNEQTLGVILAIAGAGMLMGTVVMAAWGGPRRQMNGVLAFTVLLGTGLIILGWQPTVTLVALGGFIIMFAYPILNGCNEVIWLRKVEPDMQGRISGIRTVRTYMTVPYAYLTAGAMADWIFEPLLAPGGTLAGNVGQLIGVGAGRGVGLLLILAGLLPITMAVIGYLYTRLRLVEDELPDAMDWQFAEPVTE